MPPLSSYPRFLLTLDQATVRLQERADNLDARSPKLAQPEVEGSAIIIYDLCAPTAFTRTHYKGEAAGQSIGT